MTLFTTNYKNLENNDNKPVPEGVYEVIIEDTHQMQHQVVQNTSQ